MCIVIVNENQRSKFFRKKLQKIIPIYKGGDVDFDVGKCLWQLILVVKNQQDALHLERESRKKR